MSQNSEDLKAANAELRQAVEDEHTEVTEKLDELLAKITALEAGQQTDEDVTAAIADTKTIVSEIKGIFNKPLPPTE
jgi:hypothetical protein